MGEALAHGPLQPSRGVRRRRRARHGLVLHGCGVSGGGVELSRTETDGTETVSSCRPAVRPAGDVNQARFAASAGPSGVDIALDPSNDRPRSSVTFIDVAPICVQPRFSRSVTETASISSFESAYARSIVTR